MKKIILILSAVILSSCTKKYDWQCTCEIYTSTTNTIETKEIKNKIKTDADKECALFGEEKAGTNGAHDCTVK